MISALATKMERFNINYSKKNIPIPTEKEYKIQLIAETTKSGKLY